MLITFDEFNASKLEPEGKPTHTASENAKDATLATKSSKVAKVSSWPKKIPSYSRLAKR